MIVAKYVKVRTRGRLGRITLDRPETVNALTQTMLEEIDFALDRLEDDPDVTTVAIDGTGTRGFCAGGDAVALRNSALEGGGAARRFWRTEYLLNARIAFYPKPVVAIMDGTVMGAGVGLAGHATYRVATETLAWAMPEVLIGFAPDVGGTYLLSRLPGGIGTWLALTARRLGAVEALQLGVADTVLGHEDVAQVLRDLAVADPENVLGGPDVESRSIAAIPGQLLEFVDECFSGEDVPSIEAALGRDRSTEAEAALTLLRRGSPTSLKATLAALRAARDLPDLEACLEQEYRTSCSFLSVDDFREGIRAVLVDKDGEPCWSPASVDRVDDAVIDAILEGPADLEPLWVAGDGERRASGMSA